MTKLLPEAQGFFNRLKHPLSAFFFDAVVACLAWYLSFSLRFNFNIPKLFYEVLHNTWILAILPQLVVFWAFGLYRGVWRFASIPDLRRILSAVTFGVMLSCLIILVSERAVGVPRSAWFLDALLLMTFMGGGRIGYRVLKEGRFSAKDQGQARPVVILGAGSACVSLLKDLQRSPEWRVVGIFDDDPSMLGRVLYGYKIMGKLSQVLGLASKLGAAHAIVAMPSATYQQRRRALDLCRKAELNILTVPTLEDLMSGKVTISQIRKVDVVDLLGRPPVELDTTGLGDYLRDQVILITGAGGSIGSELSRQIAKYQPKLLVFFEANEPALYRIEQEFSDRVRAGSGTPVAAIIGNVKDTVRLKEIFEQYKPAVVFHAAAYKHVPLLESGNSWEAIKNNVQGTFNVATAATAVGVRKFVLISTDKAVNPTNVMGATKRLAEMILEVLQRQPPNGHPTPSYVMVRFGNVLDSQGSVIPKFREQIARGGPLTITHPEITRFFMSIPEAAQLVLQAGLMGKGGDIFVLDMGEPVKIIDLARDMIKLSGLTEEEIKIEFTGLRPGEKLYEELLADAESTLPTPHPKLRIAKARRVPDSFLRECLEWVSRDSTPTEEAAKERLRQLVPEYLPQQNGSTMSVSNETLRVTVLKPTLA